MYSFPKKVHLLLALLCLSGTLIAQVPEPLKMFGQIGTTFLEQPVIHLGINAGVIQQDGSLMGWGNEFRGDIPIPEEVVNVKKFSTSWGRNAALLQNGNVTIWSRTSLLRNDEIGTNVTGSINFSQNSSNFVFQKPDSTLTGVALLGDVYGLTSLPPGLGKVKSFSLGQRHGLAVDQSGTVWSWGDDVYGGDQLPTFTGPAKMVSASPRLNAAVMMDGTVAFWGTYASEQPDTLEHVSKVVCYGTESIMLFEDGSIYYTGANEASQYSGTDVIEIGVTNTNPSYLTRDGHIGMFGGGDFGEDGVPYPMFDIVDIHCTNSSASFIGRQGDIRFLGYESGIKSWTSIKYANQVDSERFTDIIFDDQESYTLNEDGVVDKRSSSGNDYGHFMNISKLSAGDFYYAKLNTFDHPSSWTILPGLNTSINDLGQDIVDLDCGSDHCIARDIDGKVITWGQGPDLKLNVPTHFQQIFAGLIPDSAVDVAAGTNFSLILDDQGQLHFFGDQSSEVYPLPTDLPPLVDIECGDDHVLALTEDSTVIAWGNNAYNQLDVNQVTDKVSRIFANAFSNFVVINLNSDIITSTSSKSQITNDVASYVADQNEVLLQEHISGILFDASGIIQLKIEHQNRILTNSLSPGIYMFRSNDGRAFRIVKPD